MSEDDQFCGKIVQRSEYDYDTGLSIHFTDGTMLFAQGVWHNDSTAGVLVALLGVDDPKSWEGSRNFYDVVHQRKLAGE